MAEKLTRAKVDKLKYNPTGSKIQRVWDLQIPGLGVEVFPSGRKSWILRYRFNRKQKFMTLGKLPAMDIELARDTATGKLRQLQSGSDPKHDISDSPTTIEGLYRSYIASGLFKQQSDNTRKNFKFQVEKYILPELGGYDASAITVGHVAMLIQPIVNGGSPAMGSSVREKLSTLMEEAVFHGVAQANPHSLR